MYKKFWLIIVFFASVLSNAQAQEPKNLTILAINGAGWDEDEFHKIYYSEMRVNVSDSSLGEESGNVEWLLLYNDSFGFTLDFAESASQKLEEAVNIPLSTSLPIFTSIVTGLSDPFGSSGFAKETQEKMIKILDENYGVKYIENSSAYVSLNEALIGKAFEITKARLLANKKVILFGESQGALFHNEFTRLMREDNDEFNFDDYKSLLGQYYVATPTAPNLDRSHYIVNDEDVIMTASLGSVQATNDLKILFDIFDDKRPLIDIALNHFLHTTYLNISENTGESFIKLRQDVLNGFRVVADMLYPVDTRTCPGGLFKGTLDSEGTFTRTVDLTSCIQFNPLAGEILRVDISTCPYIIATDDEGNIESDFTANGFLNLERGGMSYEFQLPQEDINLEFSTVYIDKDFDSDGNESLIYSFEYRIIGLQEILNPDGIAIETNELFYEEHGAFECVLNDDNL